MAAKKASTKKALETKIAALEAKLSKLSAQLETPKPAETKPAEVKPAETKPAEVKPAETKPAEVKPAETKPAEVKPAETKPAEVKPAETKPAEVKPAETKPAEVKPAETKPAEVKPAEKAPPAPVTFQAALEDAYSNATMTSFHDYRAKVTGYVPAANRYFVRLHAPVGKVPTSNWNEQKAKVTGYTQPSNQYFATRQRLAYSPPGKTFGSFSGVTMSVEGVEIKAQTQEPPKPAETTQAPPPQSSSSSDTGKSKKQSLEEYEADYMQRMADQQRENEELMRAAAELNAKRQAESSPSDSSSKKGALPKGF
ncbi:MAG: trans-sialidase [Nitrosopumilus sp.]|nr:trans-sialidase [Nitrosopumilus sp.]